MMTVSGYDQKDEIKEKTFRRSDYKNFDLVRTNFEELLKGYMILFRLEQRVTVPGLV